MVRWQLSTPVLAIFVILFTAHLGATFTTVLANLVGGLLFFWVDSLIFKKKILGSCWQVEGGIRCSDCGKITKGYRLVQTQNYDKWEHEPQFRCKTCSEIKAEELRKRGVDLEGF